MRLIILLILIVGTQFLFACGGGGDSDTPPDTTGKPGPTDGPYALYSGSINAIDLNDPSKTYKILDSTGFEGEILVAGQFNSSGTAITNLKQDRAIFYDDNKYWTLDLNQGSNLEPIQLTNFEGEICEMEITGNGFNLDESLLFFQVPGADSTCSFGGDDQILMTRLDADASDPPVNITGKLNSVSHREFIYNSTDPTKVDHLLVVNDNNLVLHNPDLSDTGIIKMTATSSMSFLDAGGVSNSNGLFIESDGNIYFYDNASQSVGAVLHTITSGYSIAHINDERLNCNATLCVFAEQSTSSSDFSIYKIPTDGSASSILLDGIAGSIFDLNDIRITNATAYVELKNTSTDKSELKALALSGGALNDFAVGDDLPFMTVENYMYYTIVTELPGGKLNRTAYVIEDGSSTPTLYPNSVWLDGTATEFVIGEMEQPNKIILAFNYTSDDTHLDGASLRIFESKTFTEVAPNLGTITGTDIIYLAISSVGDKVIGVIATTPDPETTTDIFYVDFSQADSYQRITDDTTHQEEPLGWFFENF